MCIRDSPDTLAAMHYLASSYHAVGQSQEALKLREETLKLRQVTLGPDHPDTLAAMHNLANSYRAAGQSQEALKLREETLKLKQAKLGPDHPDTLRAVKILAFTLNEAQTKSNSYLVEHEFNNAEVLLLLILKHRGQHKDKIELISRQLHLALLGQRKWQQGSEVIGDWEKQLSAHVSDENTKRLAWADTSDAVCQLELGKFKEAEMSAKKALSNEFITKSNRHRADSVLAVCLAHQKEFDSAAEKATEAFNGLEAMLKGAPQKLLWYIPRAAERVIKVYELAENRDEVKKWKAKLEEVESRVREMVNSGTSEEDQ